MTKVATAISLLLCAGMVWSQQSTSLGNKAKTPEALKDDIEALKPAKVAWREIRWKTCLLEGLKESRDKRKPVLLWVFIDRPTDDGRC